MDSKSAPEFHYEEVDVSLNYSHVNVTIHRVKAMNKKCSELDNQCQCLTKT